MKQNTGMLLSKTFSCPQCLLNLFQQSQPILCSLCTHIFMNSRIKQCLFYWWSVTMIDPPWKRKCLVKQWFTNCQHMKTNFVDNYLLAKGLRRPIVPYINSLYGSHYKRGWDTHAEFIHLTRRRRRRRYCDIVMGFTFLQLWLCPLSSAEREG